jgi:hypothetical protein
MIIEHRTYTFHPGKIPEFLSYYLPEALALQRRILGNLVGYFSVEVGPLNQFVHLWGYESFEDRARRRALLMAEPLWQGYLARAMPLIQHQESKILLPTAFSPLQ